MDNSLKEFTTALASKAATPGGGGASALIGSIGIALGSMVGNLTLGKKKYAAAAEELSSLGQQAETLRAKFLSLIEEDAQAFEPLSKAYSLPKTTAEEKAYKQQIMEAALLDACRPPMEIMRAAAQAISIIERYEALGAAIAISDAGVGAVAAGAALRGASLNVFINTQSMTDRYTAATLEAEANALLDEYTQRAEAVYQRVCARVKS